MATLPFWTNITYQKNDDLGVVMALTCDTCRVTGKCVTAFEVVVFLHDHIRCQDRPLTDEEMR